LSGTSSSGLPVRYISSNPSVAAIINNQIHIAGAGSCEITASQNGNKNYNPAVPVIQSLSVQKSEQTITFSNIPAKVIGDPDFLPVASASSGLLCAFTSSDTAVAIIVNGQIHIKGVGTSVITAKQDGNANYYAASEISQDLVVSDLTGLLPLQTKIEFEFYPNPAGDFLTILPNLKNSRITIFNSLGIPVYSNADSGLELFIPVSQIGESGMYYIQVNSCIRKFCIAR
jgi:hypothetical protein